MSDSLRKSILLAAAFAAACGMLYASEPAWDSGALMKTLREKYPDVRIVDIVPSKTLPGLYEVFTGTAIVYTTATGDYVLSGQLIESSSRKDVTAEKLEQRLRIDFGSLPLERAIRIVRGDGSRRIAMFTDPDCPFCQQFEKELALINNATIYNFLFPIEVLHPEAPAKARAIWCADDRAAAWTTWMAEQKLPAELKCQNDPIEELQQLAKKLHVISTPTIFFPDGQRLDHGVPAAQFEELLKAHSREPARQSAAAIQ